MVRCITCNVYHMRHFCKFFLLFGMILYCRIQLPVVYKQRDVRRCSFRWSIPPSFDYVWNSSIDMAMSTPSCSYCVWNRYFQNHSSILSNLLLIAWFDTHEFSRLPCSNNKMNDDAVYANRFRYQLTMFEVFIFIRLSRLLDTHIAYEIAIQKSPQVTALIAGFDLSSRTVVIG